MWAVVSPASSSSSSSTRASGWGGGGSDRRPLHRAAAGRPDCIRSSSGAARSLWNGLRSDSQCGRPAPMAREPPPLLRPPLTFHRLRGMQGPAVQLVVGRSLDWGGGGVPGETNLPASSQDVCQPQPASVPPPHPPPERADASLSLAGGAAVALVDGARERRCGWHVPRLRRQSEQKGKKNKASRSVTQTPRTSRSLPPRRLFGSPDVEW